MNVIRRRRMFGVLLLCICGGLVATLVVLALKQNMNLYFTPMQIHEGIAPPNVRIRIGGKVMPDSLKRQDNMAVQFVITDYHGKILVRYRGILPDLFREGGGAVVLGKLQSNGDFEADEILAKHDENYMPPELQQTLQTSASK